MIGFLLAASVLAPPTGSAAEAFADVLAQEWDARLRANPLLATSVGDHRFDDRLPSVDRADFDRALSSDRAFLARLKTIDAGSLSAQDRVSLQMLQRELSDRVNEHAFGAYRIPFTTDEGFHIAFARLPNEAPRSTTKDYENYTSRLRGAPAYFAQETALMRDGLRNGFTAPRVVLDGFEATIEAHVVDDPEKSAFFAPFLSFPSTVPDGDRARLRAAGRQAVAESVVPAYRDFLKFFVDEYRPGARTSTAASELPQGKEYYAFRVKAFTTLDVTPDEVHAIGQNEVARIHGEMLAVMKKTGFRGDFAAFLQYLRTEPRFYPKTAEELLKEGAYIAKRMDGRLPSLFGKLPRLPYGVEAVPDAIAPKYTGGRYNEAPIGGSRGGYYWINTFNLSSRPLYVMEALTLHEAVPGHHLQIALQREIEGQPPFRRVSGVGAFVEGWALYSERLGLEAGFYTDPYSDFGRLTYEMWRACRLVVDTGLHAKGWTRQQAMDFMAANTALSLHEIKTETDRYIAWPGQALAYKMGEIKIRALREKAEKSLGNRFDVRRFHDAVLANGPVPLDVLEQQMDAFIAAERGR